MDDADGWVGFKSGWLRWTIWLDWLDNNVHGYNLWRGWVGGIDGLIRFIGSDRRERQIGWLDCMGG
jgi:hypothetical protein